MSGFFGGALILWNDVTGRNQFVTVKTPEEAASGRGRGVVSRAGGRHTATPSFRRVTAAEGRE